LKAGSDFSAEAFFDLSIIIKPVEVQRLAGRTV
jgi:hypothetical protein